MTDSTPYDYSKLDDYGNWVDLSFEGFLNPDDVLAFQGSEFADAASGGHAQALPLDDVLRGGGQTRQEPTHPDPSRALDDAETPFCDSRAEPIHTTDHDVHASCGAQVEESMTSMPTADGEALRKEEPPRPHLPHDHHHTQTVSDAVHLEAEGAPQRPENTSPTAHKRPTAQKPSESNKRSKLESALAVVPEAPPPKPRSGTKEWVGDRETFHAAVGKVQMHMPENDGVQGRDEFDEDESATVVDRAHLAFEPYPCRYKPCPSEEKPRLFMTIAQRDQHEMIHEQSAEAEGPTLAYEPFPCRFEGCKSKHQLFTTPSTRDKHEKIHNEFHCKPCRRHYSSQEQLDQHQADNHANGEKRPISCGFCEKQYSRKDYVTRHVKAVHPEEWETIQEAKRTRTRSIASSQTAVDPTLQPSIATSPKLDPLSSSPPAVYPDCGQQQIWYDTMGTGY